MSLANLAGEYCTVATVDAVSYTHLDVYKRQPWDLGVFESLGIDPREARFILVKSRMYCRPVFVPISCALVECDSPGVTSSDFSLFPYQRRNRPRYPLEPFKPAQVSP